MKGIIPIRGQIKYKPRFWFCLFSEENAEHGVTTGKCKERGKGIK